VKIAVVGTGIAGLSAAWMLSQRHEVTVFEQERRIGGHSNTVEVARADGKGVVPVDTGFIVFNHATYPNLCALFDRLNVPTIASDMSFGVSIDSGRLEYSADGLFAQKRNLLSPTFLLMLRDIVRFYREAPGVLTDPSVDSVTLGDWLAARRYGNAFVRDHLLPMGAAIWSAPIGEMMGFPVGWTA
jgi:predicted NAD/FAD-binding protein